MANALVLDVYRASATFPPNEQFGLQSQMRRAAVSVASNIVEGSGRLSTREYVHFLNIASGSATENCYLSALAGDLGILNRLEVDRLVSGYSELSASLRAMIEKLRGAPDFRARA